MTNRYDASAAQDAIARVLRGYVAMDERAQKDIAEAIGIGPVVLSRYLQGHREFPSTLMIALIDALGVSPIEFWDRAREERERKSA